MLDVRTDKQWLTAAEAAAELLPEFPVTKRHINRIITEQNIATRKRAGRGGGREFHWSDLPEKARAEYLKRHGVVQNALHETDPKTRAAVRLLEADARAAIIARAKTFAAERNLTNGKGMKAFCAAYAKRRAGLEPIVYETVPRIEPHRIMSWERKLRSGGTIALVDGRGRPAGGSWIEDDADLRACIVATIAARPHLSARAVQQAIAAELQRDVPLRTLQAFLASLKKNNRALVKALTDPDRARSHHKPAFGSRSMNVTRINQLWEIDASPADAMCATAEGPRSATS
jgi:putative transposase